jgi:hypothetical protein
MHACLRSAPASPLLPRGRCAWLVPACAAPPCCHLPDRSLCFDDLSSSRLPVLCFAVLLVLLASSPTAARRHHALQDQDQEVKECAISCMASAVAALGDVLGADVAQVRNNVVHASFCCRLCSACCCTDAHCCKAAVWGRLLRTIGSNGGLGGWVGQAASAAVGASGRVVGCSDAGPALNPVAPGGSPVSQVC